MNNYGLAIKARRENWGEKQQDLAAKIGVSGALISKIENGKKRLSLDVALRIASHYRTTVEDLLRTESRPPEEAASVNLTKEEATELQQIYVPIVSSVSAEADENFSSAHKAHKAIYRTMSKYLENGELSEEEEALFEELVDECVDHYDKAWERKGIIEAGANALGLLILFGAATVSDLDAEALRRRLSLQGRIVHDAAVKLFLRSAQSTVSREGERREFLEEFWDDIVALIKILKNSEQWKDLGDYYLALLYQNGLVQGELGIDECALFGNELMTKLKKIGNKYAKSYLNFFQQKK